MKIISPIYNLLREDEGCNKKKCPRAKLHMYRATKCSSDEVTHVRAE